MKPGDVLIDWNRRSVIIVAVGRVNAEYVRMDEGELVVRTASMEHIAHQYTLLPGYPVKRAIRVYLKHSGGVSAKAKAALKALKEVS